MKNRPLFLLVLFLNSMGAAALAGVTVEVKAEAAVAADYVRLADIAEIRGDSAAAERLGRIFLGPAPAVSASRSITRDEIRARLRDAGCGEDIALSGAPAGRVTRSAEPATPSAPPSVAASSSSPASATTAAPASSNPAEALVGRAVAEWLARQLGRTPLEGEAKLLSLDRDLPAETASLEAREIVSGRLPGRAEIRLVAKDAQGEPLGYLNAKVDAWASAEVLMLRRPVKQGEPILPEDLTVARARLQPGAAFLPARPEAVAGCQATRAISAMAPLAEGDLEIPLAVRRGEPVSVETNAGCFRVRSVAKALANGRLGEFIVAENPETRKRYAVRVIGPGLVAIPSEEGR
jgi:flagella basal body P-ring formation protein FlgA